MFLWSRAGQCHSEVPGKCTARLLNSSTRFFVHLSNTRQPVPYCRVAWRCLDGTCNEEPARQGEVVWFFSELWGTLFISCEHLGWHGTTILILGWNPGISEVKEIKEALFSFSGTRISTTYVSVPCSFRYGNTEGLEMTWIYVAM